MYSIVHFSLSREEKTQMTKRKSGFDYYIIRLLYIHRIGTMAFLITLSVSYKLFKQAGPIIIVNIYSTHNSRYDVINILEQSCNTIMIMLVTW